MRLIRLTVVISAASMSASCADLGQDAGRQDKTYAIVQRDSANTRIVEHDSASISTGAATWRLSDGPLVRIGNDSASESDDLHQIVARAILADGRIALGLRSGPEVRIFDAAGMYVRTIGQRGEGPGEFRSLAGPWISDHGTLAMFDSRLRRLTTFDTSGTLRHAITFQPATTGTSGAILTNAVDGSPDGRLLVVARRDGPPPGGLSRPPILFHHADSTGGLSRAIGPYPGQEIYMGQPQNGFAPMGIPPFALTTLAAACGGGLAITDNGAYDIRLVDGQGAVAMIVRVGVDGQPVADDDFTRYAEAQTGGRIPITTAMLTTMREMTPHERLPVLHNVTCDESDNLWVEEFARPGARHRRIASFSNDGTLRGVLMLDAAMRLLHIRGDRLLLATGGTDAVETVEVREVVAGPP